MTDVRPARRLGTLISREMVAIGRSAAYWAAVFVYLTALAVFIVIWGDGVPLAGAGSVWKQFAAVQAAILIVLLPWVAGRCHSPARADVTIAAALMAVRPSELLVARCVALVAALLALALTALPLAVIVQQVSALPVSVLLEPMAYAAALAIFVASLTTACMIRIRNRLFAWASASLVTVAVGYASARADVSPVLAIGICAAAASTLLLHRADSRLIHLAEEPA